MQDVSEVGWPEPRLGRGARVLVTGAAGGLGANLVKALVETGYRVRAVDRVELADTHLARDPWIVEHAGAVEWVRADLQVGRLRGLVAGCDGVVHAAARVSLTEDYDAFVGPNVEVTRRLRQAARQAGVDHLVYVSCGTLYAPTGGVLDEDSPLELTTGYARSKREAEWAAQSQAGPAWTILRPGLLYGPYCRTMSAGVVTLPPILRQFISYVPGLTGGPRTNWCHVTDAARAACFVLGRPAAQGRVLNVADATPLGLGEVLTAMTEACGLELGPLLPFPTTMTRGVLTPLINHDVVFDTARTVLRQLWKRVQTTHQIRSPLRPRVDRKALHHTSGDAIVDASALRALGWVPRWEDLREGIVPTVQWYQARGWLPRYDTQAALELEQATQTRGFGFNEELTGQLELEGGACRSMTLDLDAAFGPTGLPSSRLQGLLDGAVQIQGIVAHAPLQGTLTVDWLGAGQIVYEFGFEAGGERAYRFCGRKDLDWAHPIASVERLTGELVDARGQRVGLADLRFDAGAQLVPFLVSLRFLLRERLEEAA